MQAGCAPASLVLGRLRQPSRAAWDPGTACVNKVSGDGEGLNVWVSSGWGLFHTSQMNTGWVQSFSTSNSRIMDLLCMGSCFVQRLKSQGSTQVSWIRGKSSSIILLRSTVSSHFLCQMFARFVFLRVGCVPRWCFHLHSLPAHAHFFFQVANKTFTSCG